MFSHNIFNVKPREEEKNDTHTVISHWNIIENDKHIQVLSLAQQINFETRMCV